MERLVISCMDRRLNLFIEEQYPDAVVLRNAGANVYALESKIKDIVREKDIREIIVLAHTDCGAMGKVYSVLKQNAHAEEDLAEELISHYSGLEFSTREELESENYRMQVDELKAAFPSLRISGELIDMKNINVPAEDKGHRLLVMEPSKPNYSKIVSSLGLSLFQCYIVQGNTEIAMPDIKLAASELHANPVYFVTQDGENPRTTKQEADKAKLSLSQYKGIEINRHDMRSVKKSMR